jgi:hypothetical protein
MSAVLEKRELEKSRSERALARKFARDAKLQPEWRYFPLKTPFSAFVDLFIGGRRQRETVVRDSRGYWIGPDSNPRMFYSTLEEAQKVVLERLGLFK